MSDETYEQYQAGQMAQEIDDWELEDKIAEVDKLEQARTIKAQRQMKQAGDYWYNDELNKIVKESELTPLEMAELQTFLYQNPQKLEKAQRKQARKFLETSVRQWKKSKAGGQPQGQAQGRQQAPNQPPAETSQRRAHADDTFQTVKKEVGQGRRLSDDEQMDLLDMFLK